MPEEFTPTLNTPVTIEGLLHYHYSPEDWDKRNTPAGRGSINLLVHHGLLDPNPTSGGMGEGDMCDPEFVITERGVAMVKMLCNLPLPKKVYVDHNGKEIRV